MSIVSQRQEISPAPALAPIPRTAEARLIDKGLLHYEASIAGFAERYGRGETSHTVHVWWARRPHTAMRSLVFASLCKDTNDRSYNILTQIGASPCPSESLINNARQLLEQQYNSPPKVLDMFGGGGTIPYESLNLGAEAYSLDSNELSVFVQKCNLLYSQAKSRRNMPSILSESGHRVLQQLAIDTDPLFPLRREFSARYAQDSPIGYVWTYSTSCDQCGYRYYLSKRPWLSKKRGRNLALKIHNSQSSQKISIEKASQGYKHGAVWTSKNGMVQCPKCKATNRRIDISLCTEEIVAIIRPSSKTHGKEFSLATEDPMPSSEVLEHIESETLRELNVDLPSSSPPVWSGIVNPPLYGMRTHSEFLNPRQRTVLLLLIKNLSKEYQFLTTKYDKNTATYSVAFLSGLIDQMVDWNCRLSMWIPQNEQVGRAFCGPGIAMLWDYVETDPLMSGPSNLWAKLRRIINAAKLIPTFPHTAHLQHGYAQALPFPGEYFDAIVTDPPYYDNLFYNVLADYFFAWKRLLLSKIDRNLFQNATTDSKYELVSSTYRNGTSDQAHEEYCLQLAKAIKESCRTLKSQGVMSFVFSHTTIKAWEALVRAYRPTEFVITSVQPLSIERKQRPRAMTSEANNTCLVFVAHKSKEHKKQVYLRDLMTKLENISSSDFVLSLENSGWNERDTALALYAQGVALLGNVTGLLDCSSDLHALLTFEQIVHNRFPEFAVKKRKSL